MGWSNVGGASTNRAADTQVQFKVAPLRSDKNQTSITVLPRLQQPPVTAALLPNPAFTPRACENIAPTSSKKAQTFVDLEPNEKEMENINLQNL